MFASHRSAARPRPEVDTDTPAVVFKLDPNVFHHGGLGVIRSLGRLGVPVYAMHQQRLTPAASSRYVTGGLRWRPDAENVQRLRSGLVRLADRIGRPAVLIPTDDAGALFLAEHGDPLRRWFLFPRQRPELPRVLAGKYSLFQLCQRFGVPCADALLPEDTDSAREFVAKHGLPVIAKLTTPWTGAGTVRSTTVVHSVDELIALLRRCRDADTDAGVGLMLQEYLPSSVQGDWFFHGYCDADSICRPSFTGTKARSYPAHAGLTSFGAAKPNGRLIAQVHDLLSMLGYRGVMDLDLRLDPRDGQYKLLDFNPRIGAQFRLFHDAAGVDVAIAAHLDLTGRPIPVAPPVQRTFLVENYDPISALRYWRGGQLSPRDWLRTVRSADELAWFARDDLAPFSLMCLRMGWRVIERPFSKRFPRHTNESSPPVFRDGRAAKHVSKPVPALEHGVTKGVTR